MSSLQSVLLVLCLFLTGGLIMTDPVLGEDVVIQSLAGADTDQPNQTGDTPSPVHGEENLMEQDSDGKGSYSLVDSGIRFVDLIGEVRVYTPCLNSEEDPATLSTVLHVGDYIYTGEWGQAIMQLPGSIQLTLLRDSEFIVGVATDCNKSESSAKVTPQTGPTDKPGIPETNQTTPVQTPEPAVATEPAIQSDSEAGEAIPLSIGETYTITLPQNPTTGFMWEATVSGGLTIKDDTYIPDQHPPGWVGGGGTRKWTVQAVKEGKQTFYAVYRRSWEPITGDEDSHFMEFRVIAGTPDDSVLTEPAPEQSPSQNPTGDITEIPAEDAALPESTMNPSGNAGQIPESADIPPEEEPEPEEGSGCGWEGIWDTSYKTMQLIETGTSVSGTYDYKAGKITGTVSGRNLSGTWQETVGSETNHGPVQLTMSDDCNSFTGQWKHEGSEYWNGHWTGERVSGENP